MIYALSGNDNSANSTLFVEAYSYGVIWLTKNLKNTLKVVRGKDGDTIVTDLKSTATNVT